MSSELHVLLVEDDPSIVEIVKLGLSYEGARVDVATDGLEAVRLHRELRPDIVVLDLMLPKLDGFGVLERIRAHRETPVIMLTARDGLEDRVGGLDAGADDYLTKPFQFAELIARMRAVLRRHGHSDAQEPIEIADLRIDPQAHEVTRAGGRIELTPRQFDLLLLLAENARHVLSKQQIFDRIWGWEHSGDLNVIEQHVSHLRDRVDAGSERPLIHTVRGVGYVLRDEGAPI